MATEAQVRANRLNALKSTGPRTVEGKAVVAQNAVRHGLSARQAVIVGEDVGEYEFYREQMLAELAPEGAMESALAQRAVGLAWRLRRAERLQNEAFDTLYDRDVTDPFGRLMRKLRAKEQASTDGDEAGRDLTCGRIVVHDFGDARVLDRLLLYERRLEHSLYKTIDELQRLRLLRLVDAPATEPEGDCEQTLADRAKQTQFASISTKAKCSAGKDVDENADPAPAPKQSQSKPISPAQGPGEGYVARPDRDAEPRPGGFQPVKRALYSVATAAGCGPEPSAGAARVGDTVERESS